MLHSRLYLVLQGEALQLQALIGLAGGERRAAHAWLGWARRGRERPGRRVAAPLVARCCAAAARPRPCTCAPLVISMHGLHMRSRDCHMTSASDVSTHAPVHP